jgi:hypothetical protein
MDEDIKIINIRYKNYILDNEDLIELSKFDGFGYRFTTVVAYNKKTKGRNDLIEPPLPESYNNESPFSLYRYGTPIAVLKSYIGNNINKNNLSSANKAFKELKNFTSQCCERITADLCCQVIMKEIDKTDEPKKTQELVFFIEKSASDKMLGRLASLQLNLDNIIICFLTFDPSDLMTIAMSNQTSKLHFDINRLMRPSSDSDFFGPYPGDSEDSLVQTYFHRPFHAEGGGGEFSPMRFDIFSQGLRIGEIEKKKEKIEQIFSSSEDTEKERTKIEPRKLMPMGWEVLKEHLNRQDDDIKEKLREHKE